MRKESEAVTTWVDEAFLALTADLLKVKIRYYSYFQATLEVCRRR